VALEFKRIAEISAALMKLHIEYEKQKEYPQNRRELAGFWIEQI
jgi:hypothetical protein